MSSYERELLEALRQVKLSYTDPEIAAMQPCANENEEAVGKPSFGVWSWQPRTVFREFSRAVCVAAWLLHANTPDNACVIQCIPFDNATHK